MMKITVAGVGYASWSLALLLSQHREVSGITTTEKNRRAESFCQSHSRYV